MGLPHHLRIAALQCNFEGGRDATLGLPRKWREFGFNVEQLFHTHSENYTAAFDSARHADLLHEYLDRCRTEGVAVLLYMNCHTLLESQAGQREEWAQVARDGSFIRPYGTHYGCCLNSAWIEHFLESIESLASFDLAGIFFDGPSASECFCERCDAKFRLEYERPIVDAAAGEVTQFHLRSQIEFVKCTYGKVKATNPRWLSYVNANIMGGKVSATEMQELLSYNDLVGTEGGFQFYGPPRDADIWRCGLSARMVEAAAGGKPGIIFMAGDHKPWSWYLHTPAETKLCYASALANGVSVWYGIHCSTDHLDSAPGEAARQMVRFDRAHSALYERTESLADVAVLFSYDTAKAYSASGEESDFYENKAFRSAGGIGNYRQSLQGAYGALFRSGIPCDILTELNLSELSGYSVLVIPTGACMSEEMAGSIREFVARGGMVIADSETSLYDAGMGKREDFLLSDVFGVTFQGYRKYEAFDYFCFRAGHAVPDDRGIEHVPAPLVAVDVTVAGQAEVLADLCPPLAGRYAGKPEAGRYPFVVRNRSGDGMCYYFAGTFFELYRTYGVTHYRQIIERLVRQHSRPVVQCLDVPESIEVTVRKSQPSGEVLVHLVNYTGGMTRPIDRVVPVSGLRLQLAKAASSARALVSGEALAIGADGAIDMPTIHEFEVVVLE